MLFCLPIPFMMSWLVGVLPPLRSTNIHVCYWSCDCMLVVCSAQTETSHAEHPDVFTCITYKEYIDAVEAHSYEDDSTDKRFLSTTQLIGKVTTGRFDPKVFVNCVHTKTSSHLSPHSLSCTQLTKTFRSKRPAVDISFSCVLLKNRLSVK